MVAFTTNTILPQLSQSSTSMIDLHSRCVLRRARTFRNRACFNMHFENEPQFDSNQNYHKQFSLTNNLSDENFYQTTYQSQPPPGREDEFEDANGDDLDESRGKSVATLDRDSERSFDTVLQELTAIQQDGPRNVAILGTRYSSFLHQQIIELLTYANVLVGNHVFTSGAGGTNAAVIRGALRAEKPELLTVVLPQSLHKQPKETQEQVSRND